MVTLPTLFPLASVRWTTYLLGCFAEAPALIMATARDTHIQTFRFMGRFLSRKLPSQLAGEQRLVLLLGEWNDREPSLTHQRRSREQCTLFDVGQRQAIPDRFSGSDG